MTKKKEQKTIKTMKTLDLVLKGKWYDMIASGKKDGGIQRD